MKKNSNESTKELVSGHKVVEPVLPKTEKEYIKRRDEAQDNKQVSSHAIEWELNQKLQQDENVCPVPYFEISEKGSMFWLAYVNASSKVCSIEQAQARAELISSAPILKAENKLLYDALKDLWNGHVIGMGKKAMELRFNIANDILEKIKPQ